MSADLLREAAALMRERASHPDVSTAPWIASPHGDVQDDGLLWVCDSQSGETAEHIASWHPDVALAVAEWLDALAAEEWCCDECKYDPDNPNHVQHAAVAVARAYLGRGA